MPEKTIEKVTRIEYGDGRSLKDLDVKPRDFVGFDLLEDIRLPEFQKPFILVEAERSGLKRSQSLIPSNEREVNEVRFIHYPEGKMTENWWDSETWGIIGRRVIKLEILYKHEGLRIPKVVEEQFSRTLTYVVKSAYVGEQEIINCLREKPGFDLYANWLESEFDRLKTGR